MNTAAAESYTTDYPPAHDRMHTIRVIAGGAWREPYPQHARAHIVTFDEDELKQKGEWTLALKGEPYNLSPHDRAIGIVAGVLFTLVSLVSIIL